MERAINVYDNVFDKRFQDEVFTFAFKSFYKIGWEDNEESIGHKYLYSKYSHEDVDNLGILEKLKNTPVAHHLEGMQLQRAVVNLSTPSDTYFSHTHPEDLVILYYINTDWLSSWAGETLFYTEDMKKIRFASPFTPNRVMAFDGRIPHVIRPQNHKAPSHRFTLALFFNKEGGYE